MQIRVLNGMRVDKFELLYWLIIDEFYIEFGEALDALSLALILLSLPTIPVTGKLGSGATKGTSPLPIASREFIRRNFKQQFFKANHRTITWGKIKKLKWAMTRSIGAYIGRWVPWVGAPLTIYDLTKITNRVIHRYQMIVPERERL
ncbi:hypothetical protein FAI40_08120 [Acetobacteraceae bacterium]|nr:hypothetical protein FAI40_08120 [Acetobacteraceae bacterium]